jgi:hypothetical protein
MHPDEWDIKNLREASTRIFDMEWEEGSDEIRDMAIDEIRDRIVDSAVERYDGKEGEMGEDRLRQVERMLVLQFTDQFWKDHLLAMDRLRDGIGLRGYGQRNPLLEYKREGTDMFLLMNSLRDEAVVSRLVRLDVKPDQEIPSVTKSNARRLAAQTPGQAPFRLPQPGELRQKRPPQPAAQGAGQPLGIPASAKPPAAKAPARPQMGAESRAYALEHGLRRNDPCPCGSGLKFKKCCYKKSEKPTSAVPVPAAAAAAPAETDAAAAVDAAAPAADAAADAAPAADAVPAADAAADAAPAADAASAEMDAASEAGVSSSGVVDVFSSAGVDSVGDVAASSGAVEEGSDSPAPDGVDGDETPQPGV